ncbi:MAG: tRNA (adenosine(37)-N6)-dimethylallyltransferase MiaA, partial [Bacteroidetes bacterium]
SFRNQQVKKRDFEIVKIALDLPRPILYQRIDDRMDKMLSEGLLSEAKSFYANKNLNALQTVGYKEIYDFLDKKQTWEETVFLLKRNSRRYAKRQLTWFRKDRQTHWVLATDFEEILELCMKKN